MIEICYHDEPIADCVICQSHAAWLESFPPPLPHDCREDNPDPIIPGHTFNPVAHANSPTVVAEEPHYKVARRDVAVKSDTFKSRVELIDSRFIEGIGRVLAHGAKKYADDNWRLGFKWRRLIGAGIRHWLAFAKGEDIDPEFGEHHLLHEACESMFAYIHYLDSLGTDDRVKGKK